MDAKLSSKLDLLADNTLPMVFERNRLRGLKLNVEKYEHNINKNLIQLRDGIKTLESQLSEEEQTGAKDTKAEEEKLIQLQVKVDKLDALLGDQDEPTAREILLGTNQSKSSITKFTSIDMETDDLENGHILQLQQRIMDDQDEGLDNLSSAIGRLRELGQLTGDELETHAQLIDETEEMVDRTQHRLERTKRKLDYVGRKIKDNKSICIIIGLILVFFILLGLFN